MRNEELIINSNMDGLDLHAKILIPSHPKGIVVLVHGMAEHMKRYEELMLYYAKEYVVVMYDQRGHGDSVVDVSDYGYFGANGKLALIEDLHQVIMYVKKKFPDLKICLLGHSMGSLIVRNYLRDYDDTIDGLIVCGSPSQNHLVKSALILVKIMQRVLSPYKRSNLIQKLAFGSYNRGIESPQSENAWLCHDNAIVDAYDLDERCGFVFTLNGFETLFRLMIDTYEKTGWNMRHQTLPILFIAGMEDPCIINPKQFEKAVAFLRNVGYQNVSRCLYPKMRHEILNEIGKQSVWEDTVSFLHSL